MKYYYFVIAGVLLIILLTSVFGFAITAFAVSPIKTPKAPVVINPAQPPNQHPQVNAQSQGPIKIYGTAEEQKKEYRRVGSNQPEARVVSTEGPKPVSVRQRGPLQVDQEALREKQRQKDEVRKAQEEARRAQEEARRAAERRTCRNACTEKNTDCTRLCPIGIFSPFVANCENNCRNEKNQCLNRCG
ncbi:hypothetical protein HZA97_04425 [Candidatus Woesearchaeota archaeon]|nr:hypothetical protein [Candidatus Woesearchaeota archaeon]